MEKIALKIKVIVVKPGALACRFFCPKCTKTHLRASTGQKNFFRLAIARHV